MVRTRFAQQKQTLQPKITEIKFMLESNCDLEVPNYGVPVKQITIQTHGSGNICPIKSNEVVLQTIDIDPDPTLTKEIKDPSFTFEN